MTSEKMKIYNIQFKLMSLIVLKINNTNKSFISLSYDCARQNKSGDVKLKLWKWANVVHSIEGATRFDHVNQMRFVLLFFQLKLSHFYFTFLRKYFLESIPTITFNITTFIPMYTFHLISLMKVKWWTSHLTKQYD